MTKNPNEFTVNERVNHHIYGLGTISMISDQHTIIQFDQDGRKKFVTSLMRLEHSDVAAPPGRTRSRARKQPPARK